MRARGVQESPALETGYKDCQLRRYVARGWRKALRAKAGAEAITSKVRWD